MPQPFENFVLQDLELFTKQEFRQEAKKMSYHEKIGDLAHFLVHNFRSHLSAEEHVIDTAIKLLKMMPNEQNDDNQNNF